MGTVVVSVREKWLKTFIAVTVSQVLFYIFGYFVLNSLSGLDLFIGLIIVFINVALTMYCSYYSRGTRWLLFYFLISTYGLIGSAGSMIYKNFYIGSPFHYVDYGKIALAPLAFYFGLLCNKLRKEYLVERKAERLAFDAE